MHENQLALDPAVAALLLQDQFSSKETEPVEPLQSAGTTSYVFRVGARFSARFPMQAGDAELHRRALTAEQAAMAEFANASPFPSPRPIFIGDPGHGYPMPWSVQSWVPGSVATPDSVASSSGFASDLARLIVTMRTLDTRGRRFSGTGRGGDLTDHDGWVAHCLRQSESLLPVAQLKRGWDALRTTRRNEPDVMSHKDLIPFNLITDGQRLAGVLDTGGFGPADPALDLVAAWHLFDADRREEFRAGIGVGEPEWRRGAAWALQQALGLVWYYAKTNPPMSELGRSTIERILGSDDIRV